MATASQPLFTPEFAATFRDVLVFSLRQEMKTTAQVIAAIPEARRDYRPDPKARTAFELGWHLASADVWFLEGIASMSFEKMYENETNQDALRPGSIGEIVAWYNSDMAAALKKIGAMSPAQLNTVINFFGVFNLPAFQYIQFALNHSIHHRGQLSSYLRPMGSKVPNIYGGSADTPMQP